MKFASRGIGKIPHLSSFLGTEDQMAIIGWARKPSGRTAISEAKQSNRPFRLLEDGFVRSVERFEPPLSLVIDDRGIYYDAGEPSLLEELIAYDLDDQQVERADRIVELWRQQRVSKYNYQRDDPDLLFSDVANGGYILVCDQTFGDASVEYGRADAESFRLMLEAALEDHPDKIVVVKSHPDVVQGIKTGYLAKSTQLDNPRVRVIETDMHGADIIENAHAIYVVTSQMGFEGLLWGKPVKTFGMPFYAGWGLTEDTMTPPERRKYVSLEQLVYATLVRYSRYRHPETNCPCEVEDIIAHVGLQRAMARRFPREIYAMGFSRWKRPILKRFLYGSRIRFVRKGTRLPYGSTVALWGRHIPLGVTTGCKTIHIEDGFIRSVGLGADLVEPISWVCDPDGIYYDAGSPSRLEKLLSETPWPDTLLEQARKLRERIVSSKVTKYNVGTARWSRPETRRRVILVPGQVAGDASIRYGATAGICTNLELVQRVRRENPDSYIVYKPHPDTVVRARGPEKAIECICELCDEVVNDASIAEMLSQVDEVHTLTSLTGFEALLRSVPVTCYGQPFYAGWGLTRDVFPVARRQRTLSLDELVAGSMINYPSYVSRTSRRHTTPERALDELIQWRQTGGGALPWWRKAMRPLLRTFKTGTEQRPSGTNLVSDGRFSEKAGVE